MDGEAMTNDPLLEQARRCEPSPSRRHSFVCEWCGEDRKALHKSAVAEDIWNQVRAHLDKPCGKTECELCAKFQSIREQEREECAKIVEAGVKHKKDCGICQKRLGIAAAIRARGKTR